MAFRFFAAGTGGYRFHRDTMTDEGDAFALADALGALDSVSGGARSLAINRATSQVARPDALQRATTAGGMVEAFHRLREDINMLFSHHTSPVHVTLAARRDALSSLGESSRSTMILLFPDHPPPYPEFMRAAHPVLAPPGLNTFGVLFALARTFAGFEIEGGAASGQRMLNIQITAL